MIFSICALFTRIPSIMAGSKCSFLIWVKSGARKAIHSPLPMDYLKILHSCFLMFSFHSLDRHNSKVRQPKQTGLNLFFSSQYSFTFFYIFPKDSKKHHSKNIDIISCYSSQDIPRIFSIFLVQRTRKK